jgi:hypothetical protein
MMLGKDFILRPVTFEGYEKPIDIARRHYQEKSTVPFAKDLADYLQNGLVVSKPTCFGMAKVINIGTEDQPEFAWFVRYAAGDLRELLYHLPSSLKNVTFCRHNDGRLRKYSFKRLIALAEARRRKKEEE